MKTMILALLLLTNEVFAQSTYKANIYTSPKAGQTATLKSQDMAAAGAGQPTIIKGGNASGANVGGSVVIQPGTGSPQGQLEVATALKFTTAPDFSNGHIRNNSNTPIFYVDQSLQNAFMGAFAGNAGNVSVTGNGNTAVGDQSMQNLTSGQGNVAVGYQAMNPWTDGSDNVAVGISALGSSSSGNRNVALGAQAMNNASNAAAENVAVGRQAGFSSDAGESVYVGHRSGLNGNPATTASGATFVGARAGLGSGTQRNFASAFGYDAKVDCDNCAVIGRTTDNVGVGLIAPSLAGGLQSRAGIRLGTNANYVDLTPNAAVTSYSVELPAVAPVAGQVLKAATSSILEWGSSATGVVNNPNVQLTADNQLVPITSSDVQGIESDDPVAANRTFELSTPLNGQVFTLIWVGTNAAELLDNSAISGAGTLYLNGDWIPLQYDTITIRCANVAGGPVDCYEVARSDNN